MLRLVALSKDMCCMHDKLRAEQQQQRYRPSLMYMFAVVAELIVRQIAKAIVLHSHDRSPEQFMSSKDRSHDEHTV